MSIESAENTLKLLRIVLVLFTSLVAIGLVLEYKAALRLIGNGLIRLIRFKSNSVERCALRKMCWHFLGALLVTVGVAGEFIVEFEQYGAENKLSRASASARDELNAKAAQAEATARGFEAQIADARRASAVSQAKAAQAEATARGFEAQITDAKRAAAESQAKAAAEELARVRLQKELEPRRLTGKQKEKLRSLLSDDPQQIMFGWCLNGSDDCKDFVNDIGDAFNQAGWKTLFAPSTQYIRGIYLGFAKGSDENLVNHWVPKLRHALSAAGLASEQKWFDPGEKTLSAVGFEKNVLYLIVGPKPAIDSPASTK